MTEPATTLSTTELAARAGVSIRQLDFWARTGRLQPEHDGGSGKAREWPEAEVEVARRMGVLTTAGLPLEFAARMARDSWPVCDIADGVTVSVSEVP